MKKQELPPMKRGQFFGEIAIVSHCAIHMGQVEMVQGCVRTADVVCLENCDLLELKKDTVLSFVDTLPLYMSCVMSPICHESCLLYVMSHVSYMS